MINLKVIDLTDAEELLKLNQSIFSDEIVYDLPYFARLCKLQQGYILKENNAPIGYIVYGMTECNGLRTFTIISLGVLNSHRGKGYGKQLIKKVLEKFPEREISLHVRVTNKLAQNLYKSVGFKITGVEKDYYYQLNDDAYHMVRPKLVNKKLMVN
ncbi:MAG: ribosomal-protein-alanine N-acetyltransferase [Terrestrivirus sp.]|uniref:Ribosomal-protein-alanine N-acetyltransferase n=1 Tax=Terrestrivirus sp. TaxID=2487775 RepID=A0A3G4ZNZ3_9VIRU|nr:MAG: ribosomal-protein-alanine N-acetyltransferase [Terrestrivirus sp.]